MNALDNKQWLKIINESIVKYKGDMEMFIQLSIDPNLWRQDVVAGVSQENKMGELFGEHDMTWKDFAEYAEFLHGLHQDRDQALVSAKGRSQYERVSTFLAAHDDNRGENLSRESLFQALANDIAHDNKQALRMSSEATEMDALER